MTQWILLWGAVKLAMMMKRWRSRGTKGVRGRNKAPHSFRCGQHWIEESDGSIFSLLGRRVEAEADVGPRIRNGKKKEKETGGGPYFLLAFARPASLPSPGPPSTPFRGRYKTDRSCRQPISIEKNTRPHRGEIQSSASSSVSIPEASNISSSPLPVSPDHLLT